MTTPPDALTGLTLLLGGQKSGKSGAAARIAHATGAPVSVVTPAEAAPGDAEFAARIARHRRDRPAGWGTVETFDVADALGAADTDATVVVDALDTWLLHRMGVHGLLDDTRTSAPDEPTWDTLLADVAALGDAAVARTGATLVIAGVPGWGPIGATTLVRRYADLHGLAVQALARVARRTLLVVAGRAVDLDALDVLGGLDAGDLDAG